MEIGITLSGGGTRAAIFHLGVLRRLADEDRLEAVGQVSTVSGGSLVVAALIARGKGRWPTSGQYRADVYPALRELFTTTDLFTFKAIGWRGLIRHGTRLPARRARILADLLEERWGVFGTLRELPDRPVWWINAACLETGKNWRFSKRGMGDWEFGWHHDPPFRIAEAAAASAALPYAIGALALALPSEGWYRTDPATRRPLERIRLPARSVRLWDGGAYENLGLESLFKPREGLIGCDFLICSDASGPLRPLSSPVIEMLKGRLAGPRLFDITSDQIRALRSRMLVEALTAGRIEGALLRMGNSVRDIDIKSGHERDPRDYERFQTDQHAAVALHHPTRLAAVSEKLFDRIARHGYEIADATLTTYAQMHFSTSLAWA